MEPFSLLKMFIFIFGLLAFLFLKFYLGARITFLGVDFEPGVFLMKSLCLSL